MADLLDRTATQVRLYGREMVHTRRSSDFVPGAGYIYRTGCGCELTAAGGAMLTTRPVSCADCHSGGSVADRTREFVEAILGDRRG